MVYIGDSDTDVPCMKLVSINGGYSIGVHGKESKNKVFKMIEENRIKYFTEADYTEDSELEKLLKYIIDRTAANEVLERKSVECVKEMLDDRQNKDEKTIRKEDLIDQLRESPSFAKTHELIQQMSILGAWDEDQMERILEIAYSNSQVKYILQDSDIKQFYNMICLRMDSPLSKEIKKLLED